MWQECGNDYCSILNTYCIIGMQRWMQSIECCWTNPTLRMLYIKNSRVYSGLTRTNINKGMVKRQTPWIVYELVNEKSILLRLLYYFVMSMTLRLMPHTRFKRINNRQFYSILKRVANRSKGCANRRDWSAARHQSAVLISGARARGKRVESAAGARPTE